MGRRSTAKLGGDILAGGLVIGIVIRVAMWLVELGMWLAIN